MPSYKKCPRCELNYILVDDDYCEVCKAELKISGYELLEDEEENICPVCQINFLDIGEKICVECKEKNLGKKVVKFDDDNDIEVIEEPDEVSLSVIVEEEESWADQFDAPFDDVDTFANDVFVEDDEVLPIDEDDEDIIEEEKNDDIEDDFEIVDVDDVDFDEDEEEDEDFDDID